MNRQQFLKRLWAGAAFALTTACLGGCAVENLGPEGSTNATNTGAGIDFTLNLNDSANAALGNPGGYVIVNGSVVVGKATDGTYVAATRRCSHEPRNEVGLRNNEWYCTVHGARFNLDGRGLNSNGSNGLTIYKTELNNNILRVFS